MQAFSSLKSHPFYSDHKKMKKEYSLNEDFLQNLPDDRFLKYYPISDLHHINLLISNNHIILFRVVPEC